MIDEGVTRCTGCGSWIMINALLSCSLCWAANHTVKGISNDETNQRGANMVGASETEKGDR